MGQRFREVADRSGLVDIGALERPVDVGVSSPHDLVAYRLGMAHVSSFLASLDPGERRDLVAEAEAEVARLHDGSSLAPTVVLLSGRVPG